MVDLIDTVQELNIDDSFIELFDIELVWYDSTQNPPKQEVTIHLINGLEDGTLNLWMPYDNAGTIEWAEYLAVPIEIEGISISSEGAQGRPTLSVANVASLARSISSYPSDGDGTDDEVAFSGGSTSSYDSILENLSITKNEDIIGSIVTYRKTLRKNTYVKLSGNYYTYDDRSTIVPASPVPSPKEFPEGRFVLDRVAAETPLLVQFELASPFDIQGLKIPNRYVIGKYCPWDYKGAVDSNGNIKASVKSGCTWNNNGVKTFSVSQAPSGASDGSYNIIKETPGVTYTGNGIGWEITITLASDVPTVVVEKAGFSAGFGDTIEVSTSIIGGSTNLILSVASRLNFNVEDAAVSSDFDVCGKTIESCKKRFHFGEKEKNLPLPFGGFPGSRKFR